jgi:hypothetical protein
MTISTSRPLGTYITERELPPTRDARMFELLLLYQVEESEQAAFRWRWTYTAEQEAIDRKSGGGDGCRARHALEKQAFIRQVLRELRDRGEKLYSVEGRPMPVRGKA